MPTADTIALDLRKAVIAGVRTDLAAKADYNGTTRPEWKVEVTYGFNFASLAMEQVYLGRVRAETPAHGLRPGRNYRDEMGEFDVNVRVRIPGASVEKAEERLFAISGEVEDWISLRKSNELGVAGLQTLVVARWASDYRGIEKGAAATRTLTLAWRALLD